MIKAADSTFFFGEFELNCAKRMLLRSGVPLALNAKAFDLLAVLVANHGTVVTKSELFEIVWEGQFVEENNLTVHVSALRKLLDDTGNPKRFISTIPGKGYSFVAEVIDSSDENEIVIEQRSFSRIVVESDERWPIEQGKLTGLENAGLLTGSTSGSRVPTYVAFAAISLAVFIGVAFAYRGGLFQNRTPVPFLQNTVRQLTTNGRVGSAALSPDGKLFAYTVNDLGKQSIWLGRVNGGGDHFELIPNSDISFVNLAFSPDSQTIYYSAKDAKNPNGAIFRMSASGGVSTRLIENVGEFSLSSDGQQMIYSEVDGSNRAKILIAARTTDLSQRQIGQLPPGYGHTIGSASLSPDGGRIASAVSKPGSNAYDTVGILDLNSGTFDEITSPIARAVTRTSWLADGRSLIVTAVDMDDFASVPQYRLWHVSLDTREFTMLTPDRSNYGESWFNDSGVSYSLSQANDLLLGVEHRHATNVWVAPAHDLAAAKQITSGSFGKYDGLWGLDWTPDGNLIYTTSDTKSQYIASMRPDGSGRRPLTESGRVDSQLTVSADGKYIFFHSNRASELDVWRIDSDGSNPKQMTFGGFGYHPAPSIDGKWIYYKSYHRGSGELWRLPYDGGEPMLINENEPVYPVFSPDGKLFACGLRTDKMRIAVFSSENDQMIKQFDLPQTGALTIGIRWSPDGRSIIFRDRDSGYWRQPIDSGEAVRLDGLPKEKLYNFAYSRDGKQFAFVRGQEQRDVVLFQQSR